ncbi:MAG: 30S ribosomal protein S12 methylthiotransferase RimO [Planctomycetes bacterium]|nr:30S ribosomal protein S12 methylthiotransferase RimO [Planctomycetota bacterium]
MSLGCAKNLVDSEIILGRLLENGYALCPDYEASDVIVVNTCGFIDDAKNESVSEIESMLDLKKRDSGKRLVVAGCLSQRYSEDLKIRYPEIDAFIGVNQREELPEILASLDNSASAESHAVVKVNRILDRYDVDTGRFRLTPEHYAYVKISEGCDRTCSFCSIPGIRGKMRSKPVDAIVSEARELADSGARELILISQDTSDYGFDLGRKRLLPELLRALETIGGVDWIRILYLHPSTLSDEVLSIVSNSDKVLRYVDIPLQHATDNMLRSMKRGIGASKQSDLMHRIRAEIPGVVIRTSMIVGYPGETDADFDALCDFVREHRFDRVGVFRYSHEEGTSAFGLPEQVPADVIALRQERLLDVITEASDSRAMERVGSSVTVIVDQQVDPGSFLARSYGEAPEADPVIILRGDGLREGEFVSARIDSLAEESFDLIASPV